MVLECGRHVSECNHIITVENASEVFLSLRIMLRSASQESEGEIVSHLTTCKNSSNVPPS